MSYTATIEKLVTLAFNKLQDLARDVTLHRKVSSDFNFSSGTVSVTDTTLVVKAVDTGYSKSRKVDSKYPKDRKVKTLMFKTAEVGDLKLFDQITISGEKWSIDSITKNDGFVTIAEVVKES